MRLITTPGSGLALCSILLALVVSACSEYDSTVAMDSYGDSSLTFEAPGFLLDARAVVPENLDLTVTVNDGINGDMEVDMTQQGTIWTGSTTVTRNSPLTLMVRWEEFLPDAGRNLVLATAFNSQTSITTNTIFSISSQENGYNTNFDEDGDGVTNLDERRQGTDPLSSDDFAQDVGPDVEIIGIGRNTTIDGRQEVGDPFWDFATYFDRNGDQLSITNMIRNDSNGSEEEPVPPYQWAAIHNEEFLTIFVWGKQLNGSTVLPNGDSGEDFFNDDSVEIYWDGNLSRGRDDYDAVDDMLINIPLVRGVGPNYLENTSSAPDKLIYRGNSVRRSEAEYNIQDPALVEFGTCLCLGMDRTTWEIRINLEAAKIPIGETFGFEIQINRDDDGGLRDSKWAWAKPPRQAGQSDDDSDVTWRFPFHMGTARLKPF